MGMQANPVNHNLVPGRETHQVLLPLAHGHPGSPAAAPEALVSSQLILRRLHERFHVGKDAHVLSH